MFTKGTEIVYKWERSQIHYKHINSFYLRFKFSLLYHFSYHESLYFFSLNSCLPKIRTGKAGLAAKNRTPNNHYLLLVLSWRVGARKHIVCIKNLECLEHFGQRCASSGEKKPTFNSGMFNLIRQCDRIGLSPNYLWYHRQHRSHTCL